MKLIHKQDTRIAELCERIEKGKHHNTGVFTEAELKSDTEICTAKGTEIGLYNRYLKWYEKNNDNIQS
jgi:hypothetical protein